MRARHAAAIAAGLLAGVTLSAAQDAPPSVTFHEQLDVDRVLLPVTLEGPGCAALEPSDVRILENRDPVRRITAIERHSRSRIHALVLDTSASMGDGDAIVHAIEAAQRYVEGLPLGDRIMLVTFDDDVRLRLPLTVLRSEPQKRTIVEDLGQLTYGGGTAMRDAVYTTLRYLARFPQRKAMILLTDGVDVSSPQREGAFFEMATDLDEHDVAIFPIGWNIRRLSKYGKTLRKIAVRTGGVFYALEPGAPGDARALQDTFATIRELLLQQVIVEYVADGWSQGIRDGRSRSENGRIRREVRLEIVEAAACRPVYYRDERWVAPPIPKEAGAGLVTWPPRPQPLPSQRRPVPIVDEWSAMYGGSFTAVDEADLFVRTTDGQRVTGRSIDFAEDPGAASQPGYVPVSARKRAYSRVIAMPFEFPVTDFARLTRGGHGIEHALLDLLQRSGWAETEDGARSVRRALVPAATMPALREPVAETLYAHLPDYQEWIAGKVELEARLVVERFVVDQLMDLWRSHDPERAASLDLDSSRAALRAQMRVGGGGEQGTVWARDIVRAVAGGSSADVRTTLGADWIARQIAEGPSDDLLGFAVEAVLAARIETALSDKPLPEPAEEFLSQIHASRPLLVGRALGEAGPGDHARYAADWFEDLSPYGLATRLEREIVNGWFAGEVVAAPLTVQSAWSGLRRLVAGRGHRTQVVLLPVYDEERERIGFHRVSIARPEFLVARAGSRQAPALDSVDRREPFPARPWGFLLLGTLPLRDGSRIDAARVDHRSLDRREIVPKLLAPLDARIEAMADWSPESLRAFLVSSPEQDVHERMEALRQKRSVLKARRDEIAGELRALFREPVVEIAVEFASAGDARDAPRLLAYVPSDGTDDDGRMRAPICAEVRGVIPVRIDAPACPFVDALAAALEESAPVASR